MAWGQVSATTGNTIPANDINQNFLNAQAISGNGTSAPVTTVSALNTGKVSKVSSPTDGNFVAFDGTGGVQKDSTYSVAFHRAGKYTMSLTCLPVSFYLSYHILWKGFPRRYLYGEHSLQEIYLDYPFSWQAQ